MIVMASNRSVLALVVALTTLVALSSSKAHPVLKLPSPQNDSTVIATTSNGRVRGIQVHPHPLSSEPSDSIKTINAFRGIPFAATTGGENRWLPPQIKEPWAPQIFDATLNGPGCVQPHHNLDVPCKGQPGPRCQSEDCLNVNVFCPASQGFAEGWPVMMFIHGGSFDEGANRGPLDLYDGANVASLGGVCVVTTNYRLGVLGAMVTFENDGFEGSRGNQGILDQRAALEWIQKEIHNFGGNPNKVTLWGESAGAMSVGLHLISPKSQGLFTGAIMESNVMGFQYQDYLAQEATFGQEFKKETGCRQGNNKAVMECLRNLDAHNVTEIGEKVSGSVLPIIIDRILEGGRPEDAIAMQWAPVVDNVVIPDQPLKLWAANKFSKTPFIIGTNQDEAATFIFDGVPHLPELLFEPVTDAIFGENNGKRIVEFYSRQEKNWTDLRDSLSELLTDYWFKCSSAYIAASMTTSGAASSYVYRYNHLDSFAKEFVNISGLPQTCASRVCHATELPLTFHNVAMNFTFTESEISLSRHMVQYWTNFAATGDPNVAADGSNSSKLVTWPVYNKDTRLNLRLADEISIESSKNDIPGVNTPGVCDLLDSIGYNH